VGANLEENFGFELEPYSRKGMGFCFSPCALRLAIGGDAMRGSVTPCHLPAAEAS